MKLTSRAVSLAFLVCSLPYLVTTAPSRPFQQILTLSDGDRQPRVIRQNDSICDAGSAQWTGSVPVSEKRDLFFWYFESRKNLETAPLIIWLNGGPGASSLLGAFYERVGPCNVDPDGEGTSRNELSWTNFANVLFIDQPIGVGFSRTADPSLWSSSLSEAAIDFDKFLNTFLDDMFPELRERPIHLAGESFGGRYCPVFASMTRTKLDSVMLFNALVDFPTAVLGIYHHYCFQPTDMESSSLSPGLNSTTCAEMEEGYSACEKYGKLCTLTYDTDLCEEASEKCSSVYELYTRHVVPGGLNPYDDRLSCITPPMCGHLGMDEVEEYMNSDGLQNALGIKLNFTAVNMDLNTQWSLRPDTMLPSTREIATLLDQKQVPILVVNGNNDVVVNTEGITLAYDNLLWSGHAKFQAQSLKPWHFRDNNGDLIRGGEFKGTGKLSLVTIDGSGHMAPHDQPGAVVHTVEAWTRHLLTHKVQDGSKEVGDVSQKAFVP